METYKHAEALWLGYLEALRRGTAFDNEPDVERLRRTFRLAWDSLAEVLIRKNWILGMKDHYHFHCHNHQLLAICCFSN